MTAASSATSATVWPGCTLASRKRLRARSKANRQRLVMSAIGPPGRWTLSGLVPGALGKAVHDTAAYARLTGADTVDWDGYFPAYRR